MTTPTASEPSTTGTPWGKLIFIASALAIPICYRVGAALSGENHFGQGLEGSVYWPIFWAVQAVSLFGFMQSPRFGGHTQRRQTLLMLLAFVAFLTDDILSFAFIAFGMFPD